MKLCMPETMVPFCCNVPGIHWYGCSVQNLWDFFYDGPDCMESVAR